MSSNPDESASFTEDASKSPPGEDRSHTVGRKPRSSHRNSVNFRVKFSAEYPRAPPKVPLSSDEDILIFIEVEGKKTSELREVGL